MFFQQNKHLKKSVSCLIFAVFFGLFVFCVLSNLALAESSTKTVNLEVHYPTVSGKTISGETTLPEYVKYLFDIAMVIGFLSAIASLTIAGIMYFLSPIKASLKTDAKDRFYSAISGLLILVLTYLIITTINPQLSILNFNKTQVDTASQTEEKIKEPGIYFYKDKKCSDEDVQPQISSVRDLGQLKNKINSVGITQDQDNEIFYISILYSNPDFWGQCQYLNPNEECQNFEPFTNSASIYEYDNDPNGDGVYFYRKSCFNNFASENINPIISYCNENSGGYYKVSNDEIINEGDDSVFIAKLDSLNFINVPKEEKNCEQYDKYGMCTDNGRKKVSLGGENISSIIVNGDYLVLLFYRGPNDKKSGPWTFCQEFPTTKDVNKTGPRQIKWENIRNIGGVLPNYVMILPIKNTDKNAPVTGLTGSTNSESSTNSTPAP